MKYDILKMPCKKYKDNMVVWLVSVISIAVIAVILNVCLAVFRTDSTHTAFLAVNIVSDILTVWTIITILYNVFLPKYRLYKLFKKSETNCDQVLGQLVEKENVQRYDKINCIVYSVETDDGIRKVFVPENTFDEHIRIGDGLMLSVVNNIVCSCEVGNEE